MRRSIFVLLFLVAAFPVYAGPAPGDSWQQIDPDRDCKLSTKDGKTTIELPGTDHDLAPKRKRFNAPRLVRDVKGDFVLQVRVTAHFRPSGKSSVGGEDPSVWAGLVLIPVNDSCIRLEYGAYSRKGEYRACPAFRMRGRRLVNMEMDWQGPWEAESAPEKEAHIYLTLERQGDFIYEAYSQDGKKWTYNQKVRIKGLPEKVKVGLAACSTSTEPFKATFDQVKLHKGERKGRDPGTVFDTKLTP